MRKPGSPMPLCGSPMPELVDMDTVDLSAEAVNLHSAKEQFLANLRALEVGQDTAKHTVNILA